MTPSPCAPNRAPWAVPSPAAPGLFSVSGKLSEPKFKLHVGGVRSQEDGNRQVQAERTPCKPDRLQ